MGTDSNEMGKQIYRGLGWIFWDIHVRRVTKSFKFQSCLWAFMADWGRPGSGLKSASFFVRGTEVRHLPHVKEVSPVRLHSLVLGWVFYPWVILSRESHNQETHRWKNTQSILIFSGFKALTWCKLRGVQNDCQTSVMYPSSLPEDRLYNVDFLSLSLVSNSPQLLKYLWPCYTDSCPDAPDRTDDCWMERSQHGKPRNCPIACPVVFCLFFRMSCR